MKYIYLLLFVLLILSGCVAEDVSTSTSTDFSLKEKCSTYVDAAKQEREEFEDSFVLAETTVKYGGTFYSNKYNTCVNIFYMRNVELGMAIYRGRYTDALTGGLIETGVSQYNIDEYEESLEIIDYNPIYFFDVE